MGNLYAESGLKSDNLENTYNNRFGVTDEEYTEQVESGKRSFIDSAGYGLAQWTFRTRKQNLYDLARSYKTSVADPYMQLEFLRQEIEGNAALYDLLQSAGNVRETSDAVLTRYERPADQSDAVKEKRAALGTGYLERFMP